MCLQKAVLSAFSDEAELVHPFWFGICACRLVKLSYVANLAMISPFLSNYLLGHKDMIWEYIIIIIVVVIIIIVVVVVKESLKVFLWIYLPLAKE